MPKLRSVLVLALVLPLLGAACTSAEKPPAESPTRTGQPRCTFVRMELAERQDTQDSDSVSLMLVFTPPGARTEDTPVSTAVRVQRSRVNDIAAQLRTHPELVCEPEPGAKGGYRALLP